MGSPEMLEPYASLTTIIPAELQRPVTRAAITRASGLPRETVRRKVQAMINSGVLISDSRGGIRLKPGLLASEAFVRAIEHNETDVRRLIRQLGPTNGD
jgi:DNA-binding IclR family transcriptional regulator